MLLTNLDFSKASLEGVPRPLHQGQGSSEAIRGHPSGELAGQDANRLLRFVAATVAGLVLVSHDPVEQLRDLASVDVSAIVGLLGRFEVELNLILSGDLKQGFLLYHCSRECESPSTRLFSFFLRPNISIKCS